MKIKLLPSILLLSAVTLGMSSCLKGGEDGEITYSRDTSITHFSIGTLKITKTGKDKAGKDSVYTDTINCSKYVFSIDQLTRTIENKDSLPKGVNISKVLAKITGDTSYITYKKWSKTGYKDTLYISTDSIDFTIPQHIQVHTVNGIKGKPYTVNILVHQQDPDAITWKHYDSATGMTPIKAISLENTLFVMGKQGNTPVAQVMTPTKGVPNAWSTLSLPTETNPYSLIKWQGKAYFLAKGKLYSSDGKTVNEETPAGLPTFKQLIAGTEKDTPILYAITEEGSGSWSAGKWIADTTPLQGITATTCIHSSVQALPYNAQLQRLLIAYTTEKGKTTTIAQRLDNERAWNALSNNSSASLPHLHGVQVHLYDGVNIAFGGESTDGEQSAFSTFFTSIDQGLTWKKETATQWSFPGTVPTFYTESGRSFASTVDAQHYIWIIWGNGKLSRARVNKLGFQPIWQ